MDNKVAVGSPAAFDSGGIKVGDSTAYIFELGSGLGVSSLIGTTATKTSLTRIQETWTVYPKPHI